MDEMHPSQKEIGQPENKIQERGERSRRRNKKKKKKEKATEREDKEQGREEEGRGREDPFLTLLKEDIKYQREADARREAEASDRVTFFTLLERLAEK